MTLLEHIAKQTPSIDLKGEFLFFCNAKVATQSTVRGVLKDRVLVERNNPKEHREVLQSYSLSEIMDIFKFTIVRNPWDKAVSAFFFFQKRRGWKFIDRNETFQNFVKTRLRMERIKHNLIRDHFDFQYPKAFFNGEVFVDFIGRLENIKHDWEIISSIIGCSPNLPHKNKSKHEPYRHYYDEETKAIIADIYATDIELFGYSF